MHTAPKKKLNKRKLKGLAGVFKKMLSIRDKLFQQLNADNSVTTSRALKLFRNRVVNELKESKKNYYHQYFDENKNNMKMLWKGIKNIVNLKPKTLTQFNT